MKTREFVKKVESLGLEVHDFMGLLEVRLSGETFMEVYKNSKYFGINDEIDNLLHSHKLSLLKWLIEYVETPIEEREEPKKYYLTLPEMFGKNKLYLNYRAYGNEYFFNNRLTTEYCQTQFTQEEIDNLSNQDFIKTLIKEEVEWE